MIKSEEWFNLREETGDLLVVQVINNNLHLGPFFNGLFLDLLGVLFYTVHFDLFVC